MASPLVTRFGTFLLAAIERSVPDLNRAVDDVKAELRAEMAADGLERALVAVVTEIERPGPFWVKAVHFTNLYLDDAETRSSRSIAAALTKAVLTEQRLLRVAFFDAIDEHDTLSALEAVLPELNLKVDECVAFLLGVLRFAPQRAANLRSSLALIQWAQKHHGTACTLVESWLDGSAPAVSLPSDVLGAVVEGAVKGHGDLAWRDHILTRLIQCPDERAWSLAVWIACFGWAEPIPDVKVRHGELLRQVARLPRRLARAGLESLCREAFLYPRESFDALLVITDLVNIKTLPRHEGVPLAILTVETLTSIADVAHTLHVDVPGLEKALPLLLLVPAEAARSQVDRLLYELYELEPELSFMFLRAWVLQHHAPLWRMRAKLRDLFSLLTHKAGSERIAGWLLDIMRAPEAPLRRLGAQFVAMDESSEFPQSSLEALRPHEVEAIAHELVAAPRMNAMTLVRAIFRLLDVMGQQKDFFNELLVNELADMYPGACREELDRRRSASDRVPVPAVVSVEEALDARLRARLEHAERQWSVPELRVTSPALGQYWLWQARQMRETQRQGEQASPLMRLAHTVRVARGEGTLNAGGVPNVIRFESHEFFVELPASFIVDSVGAMMQRMTHLQQASELLKRHGGET
jgi:hypothetical protein